MRNPSCLISCSHPGSAGGSACPRAGGTPGRCAPSSTRAYRPLNTRRGARHPRTQRRARARGAVPDRPGERRRTPRRAASNRRCATAEGSELRAARGAVAGETLSVDGPCCLRPCRAPPRARRLCADAGIPGDRRGATAPLLSWLVARLADTKGTLDLKEAKGSARRGARLTASFETASKRR
jgi:hypothetical protein